jgi:hypothetical protein
MSDSNSIINLGELAKPATVLVEKIADAVGGLARPWQIKRVAEAEAEGRVARPNRVPHPLVFKGAGFDLASFSSECAAAPSSFFLLTTHDSLLTVFSRLTKLQNSRQLLPSAPLPRLTFE